MRLKRNKSVGRFKKPVVIIVTIGLLLCGFAVGAVAMYMEPYARATMDLSLLDVAHGGEAAVLYACDPSARGARDPHAYAPVGEVLDSPVAFTYVPYGEMPAHLVNAFISIEDKRFYRHSGVDFLRTARAVLSYLKGGGRSFGGSTITQQLVKNLTERDEYTPDRKLTEIFLALDLERNVHKTEILECYLNVVNLAGGCRGVGAAADYYFQKGVGELTVAESACLAAIINNPARYDPVRCPENNQRRREIILSEMLDQGYIDEPTYRTAMAEEIAPHPTAQKVVLVSSWYADMVAADVIRDLQNRLGYSRARASRAVYSGGLRIETAMDPALQKIVEDYYARATHFPTGETGQPQSAMMIIDPHTGDILGVAGAVGQKTANRVQNYALDTRRPAGSAIKPLSVYAPALEQGRITWSTTFDDAPLRVVNGRDWPRNGDGLYRGQVTAGTALSHSINTVAVRLAEEMGVEETLRYLKEELHLTSLQAADADGLHDQTLASVALGQQSGGVTLRELTAAYSIFDEGIYRAPVSYHRVLDADGRVLLENRPLGESVLSAANACVMTRMMCRTVTEGTAKTLTIGRRMGIEVAGKTGTSQNNCDRWFVGYTPRLLAGVWMGYDYPAEMKGIYGNPCLGVWDEVMQACEAAYEGAPPQDTFDVHPDVVHLSFCRSTGDLPTADCVANGHHDRVEDGWFVRGTEPMTFCDHREDEE